ncbi:MAG: toll/interleukin-1 receptor domain-containing protein [Synergistaceae bacterium]|nr:toll/interleukin-1 receptor domain-containing protein [Synergistaceae bacterium]
MNLPSYDIAISYASEDKSIVDSVYHYLRGAGFSVFYAPECQDVLVGEHQDVIFSRLFSEEELYAVLFVSQDYISKPVPMKEASICLTSQRCSHVIPVYLDGTELTGLDPAINYFRSNEARVIAQMITQRVKLNKNLKQEPPVRAVQQQEKASVSKTINVHGNNTTIADNITTTNYTIKV